MIEMRWQEKDLERVLDHLKQKVGIFKEIRERFNIGQEFGLVSMPEIHKYSDALVDRIISKDGRNCIEFYYPTERPGVRRVDWAELPSSRIIVEPICDKHGNSYFVSVYFSPGIMENLRGINLDESLFQAPDEVLKGLIAHECSEYLLKRKIVPAVSLEALKEKISATSSCFWVQRPDLFFYLRPQCEADFIASMSGCKEEMLAYLRFKRNRFLELDDLPKTSHYRPPQELAAELQARIDFIKGVD